MSPFRFRQTVAPSFLILLLAIIATGTEPKLPTSATSLHRFERLSYDLRARRLDTRERSAIRTALADDPDHAGATFAGYVDRWLTKDALKRYVGAFLRFPPAVVRDANAETFFHRLKRYEHGSPPVYYLPHASADGDQPCADDDIEHVEAWWTTEPMAICRGSHLPSRIFDDIGYCSGEAEPLMRQPPRAGCGCGPMLMGCLPPMGENLALDELVATSVMDEWFETAAAIVAENRPLDELVTTTRTWQTGLIEFLYLRREIIGMLARATWTTDLQSEIEERIATVDVYSPPRWIERRGIYEGSGLWWTSTTAAAYKVPVRGIAHHLLKSHLCSEFHAINVDADAILQAVGKQNENLRTLSSLTASPMRQQKGCRGCHGPMDGAAGFLGELQAPLFGSYPTGETVTGELMVTGADDLRGDGSGIAALAALVVAQPEFETCSVRRAIEAVTMRPLRSTDQEFFERLLASFRASEHRWRPIVREVLLSDLYAEDSPSPVPNASTATTVANSVPAEVAELIPVACAVCHDEEHHLDLTEIPPPTEVQTWKKIWSRLNDHSMPPPARKGAVARRFPLAPSVRTSAVRAIATMLGSALDGRIAPRRMSHETWLAVARNVGGPVLGSEAVEQIVEKSVPRRGFLAKQIPRGHSVTYLLAIEHASEALCRGIVSTEMLADDPHYGINASFGQNDSRDPPVRALLSQIYGSPPTNSEVTDGSMFLDRAMTLTNDWTEAWTALCATHLSGPSLLFEASFEEAQLR